MQTTATMPTALGVAAAIAIIADLPGGHLKRIGNGNRRASSNDRLRNLLHSQPAVGRNDPCPCGSEKKYKRCCLRTM